MSSRDYLKPYSDLGVRIAQESAEEISAYCLIHKDVEKPSLSFNRITGLYKCFVATCAGFSGGNFEKFYKLVKGEDFEAEVPELEIEACHQKLLSNSSMLKWLHEVRGINDESIKKWKLGFDGDRLWIPIQVEGKYVNVRKHSPNKASRVKSVSYRGGFGGVKLWPEAILHDITSVVLCEGELDCILANQMGFSSVTVTGGAGTWKDEFTKVLLSRGIKGINILYDIDLAGRAGAVLVCKKLVGVMESVKDVLLPISTPANGDFTDYVVIHNGTKQVLDGIIEATKAFSTEQISEQPKEIRQEAISANITEILRPEYLGRRLKIRGSIQGIDANPYVAPKDVTLTCKSAGNLKICQLCSIFHNGGKMVANTPGYSQDILRTIDITEEQQRTFIRKAFGVYPTCPRWEFKVDSCHVLYDIRVIPEISYSSTVDQEYLMIQAFAVSHKVKANQTYEFEGTPYPNPKNQYLTVLMDQATPIKDDLTDFKLSAAQIKDLLIFQSEPDKVAEKMKEIATDLSINVTRIYQRENLVMACDLVFHSALNFFFQGRLLQKGYPDLLVIGDTRCGKSETFLGLVRHYKAAEIITGENTSYAGLVGGTQQTGSRWITTWGKLPMNDRRMLIVDEISGMAVEDIGKMSGVRSSGVAEIIKIQSEKIFARARTIWSGNPRSNKGLSAFDTGIQAIKELIGRPEDIARFDIAIALMSGDVPLDKINIKERPYIEHKYTSDLCHNLIMWAWSRRPDQIKFTKEATELCLSLSTQMSQRYSSAIPLVEGAEQRIKLARLAVACAIRLFSTSDGETVLVEENHVKFVHDLLEESYSGQGLNYLAFSTIKIAEQNLKDASVVEALVANYGSSLIEGLLDHQWLRLTDLEDILNMDKKEVKPIVSQLLKQKAIKHAGAYYVKTPAFITLLRKMQVVGVKPKEVDF